MSESPSLTPYALFHIPLSLVFRHDPQALGKASLPTSLPSASPVLAVMAAVVVLPGKGCHPFWACASQGLFRHLLFQTLLSPCPLAPSQPRGLSLSRVEFKVLLAAAHCPYLKFLSSRIDLLVAP